MTYTEGDLREAFKAGWKERDSSPGLKRVRAKTTRNALGGAIGMPHRYSDFKYVPDHKRYHNSIWLRSAFKKKLS